MDKFHYIKEKYELIFQNILTAQFSLGVITFNK